MRVNELMTTVRDATNVRRVFGDPYEKDGITIIPAAVIAGGGGGGGGENKDGESGEGGGFGLRAAPAGAYSIRDGRVRWHPAINANLVMVVAAAVTLAVLAARARAVRAR